VRLAAAALPDSQRNLTVYFYRLACIDYATACRLDDLCQVCVDLSESAPYALVGAPASDGRKCGVGHQDAQVGAKEAERDGSRRVDALDVITVVAGVPSRPI
jgi:hypothetical protein